MPNDYYKILGIPRNASDKEVRQAYRGLARKYHPDLNPDNRNAEVKFKEINEAYQVLSVPETRRDYDAYGENWRHAEQIRKQSGGANPFGRRRAAGHRQSATYSWGTGDLGGLDGLFGDIFGSGARSHGQVKDIFRPKIQEMPVTLSLEEAYRGTTRKVEISNRAHLGQPKKQIEITIPPGVGTGSKINIAVADGTRNPESSLSLIVTVAPHSKYERKVNDLAITQQIPLLNAVLGGDIEVPTVKGTNVVLNIPPETQNGRIFRLRGQGMPIRSKKGEFGDLLVTVKVILPENLSIREKEIFEELARLRQTESGT